MARENPVDEFRLIEAYFAPLADGVGGAFSLQDDVALLNAQDYVFTKDILVEGLHFRSEDGLGRIARKALRVNLSDLAAKGASPIGYFLGCVWPTWVERKDIALFAEGLAEDQAFYGAALFGGDTTRHRAEAAPFMVSVTAFGAPPRGGVIRRSGAKAGDDLYVSGAIGDAALGLRLLTKPETWTGTAAMREMLTERYQLPTPRLKLGGALAGIASAALDVSDGLAADCGHLAACAEEPLTVHIDLEALPLSAAATAWLAERADHDEARAFLATGGDDYEIAFAAPASMRRSVDIAAKAARTPVQRIGSFSHARSSDQKVCLTGANGREVAPASLGYRHF